jgi:hypothetical protein
MPHVDWWKFCIHLRNLNVRYFGMHEDKGLESKLSQSPSMVEPLIKFHKNLFGSEVIAGKPQTDRTSGGFKSIVFIFRKLWSSNNSPNTPYRFQEFHFSNCQNCVPRNPKMPSENSTRFTDKMDYIMNTILGFKREGRRTERDRHPGMMCWEQHRGCHCPNTTPQSHQAILCITNTANRPSINTLKPKLV